MLNKKNTVPNNIWVFFSFVLTVHLYLFEYIRFNLVTLLTFSSRTNKLMMTWYNNPCYNINK